jgi:sarcosine oxidase
MPEFDVIVVGTGGVGAAALWRLASRGLRTLGLDQFDPPHDQGSTHGQTRIIRQAYFEHPDYVPLALHSYELWSALEQSVGASLFRQTGLLQVGPLEGPVVQGVLRSAAEHRLPVELLAADEVAARWPALRMPPDMVGAFEPRGGLLHVEACVTSCLAAARAAGAELRTQTIVLGWEGDDMLTVRTSAGNFTTARLIVTAGPWAGRWLPATGVLPV